MGYTDFTVLILERVIKEYQPKNIMDLGSQQLYNQPLLPAPYANTWYSPQGIQYECIDLNGENNAHRIDLSKKCSFYLADEAGICERKYDLVVDAGTSEHVGTDGAFDWEAIYNCWKIKHDLLRVGGVCISENPKTESWPSHGFQWYSESFYKELAALTDYEILELGEHPAMGNTDTGWNIYCVLRKHSEKFPTLDQFKTLSLYQQ